jgi:hypothetical protein
MGKRQGRRSSAAVNPGDLKDPGISDAAKTLL